MSAMCCLNVVTKKLAHPVSFTKDEAFGSIVWRENAIYSSEFISDGAYFRFNSFPRKGRTPRGEE